MEWTTNLSDEQQTLEMARCFADYRYLKQAGEPASVIYLFGDLGAGKTTFSRGFIQALGHRGNVKSPTYTLIEPYELAGTHLVHMDLYRLTDPEELEYLGIDDIVSTVDLCLIEWPQRGEGVLPPATISLFLQHQASGRNLKVVAHNPVGEQWIERVQTHWKA